MIKEQLITSCSASHEMVGSEVNETPLHWSISVSDIGTLYFQFQDVSGKSFGGIGDIFYSNLVNGEYTNLSASVRQLIRRQLKPARI